MRTKRIVILTLPIAHRLCFLKINGDLTIQTLVAQLPDEALYVRVLIETTRSYENRFCSHTSAHSFLPGYQLQTLQLKTERPFLSQRSVIERLAKCISPPADSALCATIVPHRITPRPLLDIFFVRLFRGSFPKIQKEAVAVHERQSKYRQNNNKSHSRTLTR